MRNSLNNNAYLVLNDGTFYKGVPFGYEGDSFGEVVFNTSMTGYQEILTDPSYSGQIVVPTYPMIGNYGINNYNNESNEIRVSGFVVRQHCEEPSHADSNQTVSEFMSSQEISGLCEVDTRAITKRIRTNGVMMGAIATGISPEEALEHLRSLKSYDENDYVQKVSSPSTYHWEHSVRNKKPKAKELKILVSDFGLKYNILRILRTMGCDVEVFPSKSTSQDLLDRNPDGILLSPGPGDPELLDYAVQTTQGLLGRVPLMGICLGNQVLGRAVGAKTYKLKFGHRGGNHPVKDLLTNKIHITSQNHGYSIDPDTLPDSVEITHISMNDQTVEGIKHKSLPAMSIQYHSEASPGPTDNEYIFSRFIEMIREG